MPVNEEVLLFDIGVPREKIRGEDSVGGNRDRWWGNASRILKHSHPDEALTAL